MMNLGFGCTIKSESLLIGGVMEEWSVQLPDDVQRRLQRLAQSTGRTLSELARQAISEYLAREELQVEQIGAALREADAGDFGPAQEMDQCHEGLLSEADRITERVRKGEERLHPLDVVERDLGLDGQP